MREVDNLFDLTGRTALVTGASRGLGQSFARALAKAGADVAITSRRRELLADFQREIEGLGRRVAAVELDVTDYDSIQRAVSEAEQSLGKIDIVVNNAGMNIRKPALEITWDDWNQVMDTNLRGAFFVAQAAARGMVQRGYGRVISVGSVTSVFGYAGLAPYGASRGGIRQLTMSLADDWGPYGVTVNCLAPGFFKTYQNASIFENAEFVAKLEERTPLKRYGQPEDLEGMMVFLASDASAFVTGQTLLVDGGFTTGAIQVMPKKQ